MANASEVTFALTLEPSFGVAPTGATPKLLDSHFTSANLTPQIQSTTSRRIVRGAQVADRVRTSRGGGGTIDDELSYGGMIVEINTGQISATSPGTFTGPSTTFANVSVGDWVRYYR